MSVLTVERPFTLFDVDGRDEDVSEGGGETSAEAVAASGPTLEELISGVWEGLLGGFVVGCPACGGEMTSHRGAGAHAAIGRCRECGSEVG